ncbi:YegP family protein [Methyloversatilis sp.]|uniref:YegP family protein n=1 Tax=Methyloversatilis sp. TaxID=2569862 RepID=UPI0035238EB5
MERKRPKFQFKEAAIDEFHFTLLGTDAPSLLQSEMYKTCASTENGIASVRTEAADDGRRDRGKASNGTCAAGREAHQGGTA